MSGPADPVGGAPVPKLLLIGMMGVGKTTTGRAVAARLGWTYLDSDGEVQRETGRTVPELFAEQGEAAFRAAEARVLREALARPEPVVVSVAGGAVLDPVTRQLVRASGTVVWLRARPETLAGRVGDGAGRPLLGDQPATSLASLYAVRRPLYDEVAHCAVDVDELTPEEVVDRVVAVVTPPQPGGAGDARGDAAASPP